MSTQETILLELHDGGHIEYPKPKGKPKFNKTNDSVEWAGFTWNPVTGCLHGCTYCYAREIAHSKRMAAFYPVQFTPLFHHYRLDAPSNTRIPKSATEKPEDGRVFVCSMADLFGKWVPEDWITQVMDACIAAPDWEYLFLTKFPQRLHKLDLPPRAWIGASIDMPSRVKYTLDALRKVEGVAVKWLSLEPLLDPLTELDLTGIDWVVIGAQTATNQPDGTSMPAFTPPVEWVEDVIAEARRAGTAIYMKTNLQDEKGSPFRGVEMIHELPAISVEQTSLL